MKDSNEKKCGKITRCATSGSLRQKEKNERAKKIGDNEEKTEKDNFLTSMDYKAYLNEINEKKKLKKNIPIRDTFCSGFFVASIPCKNFSIIEKSESFPSQCSHQSCSMLSSIEPEILMRYPLEDNDDIEISDLTATLCFPAGIKICHSDSDPEKMKDYLSLITNKVGERLYIMTFHFYLKMEKNDFEKKYEDYPLKQKLKQYGEKIKETDLKEMNTKSNNNKSFEELKTYKELELKQFAYIPYCLALISKYPYIKQIKQSLECIFKLIEYQGYNDELELNEILMYLINSIPSPNKYSIVSFPLPEIIYNKKNMKINTVELDLPNDTNLLNSNLCEIMKLFRIKNIIRIIRLLLFEKKIVFIDSDYSRLTNVINSFLTLIYPFQWVHICIPIMSFQILKYLETFVPYLAGVHTSFVPHLNQYLSENSNEKEQVYLVYIEEDKIRINDYLNEKKINKISFIHENLVNLPVWMYITLTHLLSDVQTKVKNSNERENLEYNKEIQNAFLEIFVEMFSDYNKYIYKIGDEAFFNKDEFLAKKSYFEKNFYKEFIETQMFYQFKNDILNDGYENFKNKISDRNYDYIREKLGESILRKSQFNLHEKEKTTYKIKHKFKNIIKEKDKSSFNEENYIVTYIGTIKEENYKDQKCIIYFMPNLQTIGSMVSKSRNVEKEQNKEQKRRYTEEEQSRKHQIYKMKEEIKNYILNIFKTDINGKDNNYTNVIKILKEEKIGRQYFINLISNNLSSIIFLSKNSFNILCELVSEILYIFEKQTKTNELFKDIALLIKSTMNYGIKGKMKTTTIWDLIKDKLKGNPLILQEKLWNEWYLLELNESVNLDGIYLNEVKNIILVEISKTMKILGIDKNLIIKYTNNLMKNHFDNNEIIKKTKKEILSNINN
jgi:hypothetical protein